MTTIFHASGFVHDGDVTDVRITTYEGNLNEVAMDVLRHDQKFGHEQIVHTVRSLDGDLQEVHARIRVSSTDPWIWHRFTYRSEPWPRLAPNAEENSS